MIDQSERRLDRADGGNAGRWAAFDHDDLDTKCPRRDDLAIGSIAAGILGDHDVDVLVLQQLPLVRLAEGAACQDVAAIRHGEWRIDRIDTADEIAMLWRLGEAAGLLAADGEENPAGFGSKRGDCLLNVFDAGPDVALTRFPGGTTQREERNGRFFRSHGRVCGDLVGKRMGRVDEQVDAFLSQVIDESVDAAETTDARRQGQGLGVGSAAGQRNRRNEIRTPRQPFGQPARFGRAAENQDTVLGHG